MIYVHKLTSLTPKVAELEIVPLIRGIKEKQRFPLAEGILAADLSFCVVPADVPEKIASHLAVINSALVMVDALANRVDPAYNGINLERTRVILQSLQQPLLGNAQYLAGVVQWQSSGVTTLSRVLNSVPRARTAEEKSALNQELSVVFNLFLRNDNLVFNGVDVVNEGSLAHITDLEESMSKGFLFQTTLEEELKKVDVGVIRKRLSPEQLTPVDDLARLITHVGDAVRLAYKSNLMLIHGSVVVYAYVRWVMSLMPIMNSR